MKLKLVPILRIYVAIYFLFMLTKRYYELLSDEEFYSSDVNNGFLIFTMTIAFYGYCIYQLYRASGKSIDNKLFRIILKIFSLIFGVIIITTSANLLATEFEKTSLLNNMNSALLLLSVIVIEFSEFKNNKFSGANSS